MNLAVIRAQSVGELDAWLQKIMDGGFRPSLSIVFASTIHPLNDIQKAFSSRNIQVLGAPRPAKSSTTTFLSTPLSRCCFP